MSVTATTNSIYVAAFCAVYHMLDCWRITVGLDGRAEFYFKVSGPDKMAAITEDFESDQPVVGVKQYADAVAKLQSQSKFVASKGGIFTFGDKVPR